MAVGCVIVSGLITLRSEILGGATMDLAAVVAVGIGECNLEGSGVTKGKPKVTLLLPIDGAFGGGSLNRSYLRYFLCKESLRKLKEPSISFNGRQQSLVSSSLSIVQPPTFPV